MIDDPIAKAQRLKDLLIELSPLVQEYTADVCPDCRDVCCKQKRSIMDEQDVRYLSALGMPLPVYDSARLPDDPCQFMDDQGCGTPRWLRPWRCTWYFCDPLLAAVNEGPRKKARKLSAVIQDIVDIRNSL